MKTSKVSCIPKFRLLFFWDTLLNTLSLHNQIADYSTGSQLFWRIVEGGELPSQRAGPRATVVNNVLYLSGGFDGDKELTSVLSWDPAGQTWKEAGNLTVPRSWHAAVAVPLAFGREMEDSAPEC